MNGIPESLSRVRARIAAAAYRCGRDPDSIALLAVSKTKPAEAVTAAYAAGQRAFGENYLSDALPKIQALGHLPIEWHFIGRLQSNKTAQISRHFAWVHGLDRLQHAQRLSAARPTGLPDLQICIQVNLSGEARKGGVTAGQLPDLAQQILQVPRLQLRGLMTLPDPERPATVQAETFVRLRELQLALGRDGIELDTLSMGMSADLEAAIAAGSTLVRIGTDIFGARD